MYNSFIVYKIQGKCIYMSEWLEKDMLSIRERAYLHLKDLILVGEYKTGDRLKERELAEKLKISRTPIREALLRLESQGFVKTVPRKGVVVSKISTDDIIEVFTILSSLEVLAAKLATQKLEEKTREDKRGEERRREERVQKKSR